VKTLKQKGQVERSSREEIHAMLETKQAEPLGCQFDGLGLHLKIVGVPGRGLEQNDR